MQVQLQMEGGFAYMPGLSRPITIGSETLSTQEIDKLRQLVDTAHFFDLPPVIGTPRRGAADYRRYIITVDDCHKRHTIQMTDPVEDPNLLALLTYLQTWRRMPG